MSDELPVQSGSAGLVDRAKGILMQPKAEWARIAGETTEPAKLFTSYALPLMLIGPIATFIGVQLFGYGAGIFSIKLGLGAALGMAVTSLVTGIVGLFVIAFIANLVSPQFAGRNDFPAAFRLVVYAWTAWWIGSILGLFPAIAIIGVLFGLYSLYLLYLGSGPVMGVSEDKTLGYTVVTILIAIVVQFVMYFVAATITASMFLATAGASLAADDLGQATVDLGELGRVEMDGDKATLTVDGQSVEMDMAEIQAAAERAAAQAEEINAEAEAKSAE